LCYRGSKLTEIVRSGVCFEDDTEKVLGKLKGCGGTPVDSGVCFEDDTGKVLGKLKGCGGDGGLDIAAEVDLFGCCKI